MIIKTDSAKKQKERQIEGKPLRKKVRKADSQKNRKTEKKRDKKIREGENGGVEQI